MTRIGTVFGTAEDARNPLGVSNRVIAYYEQDDAQPPGPLLTELARVLKASTDELLGLQPVKDGTSPPDRPTPEAAPARRRAPACRPTHRAEARRRAPRDPPHGGLAVPLSAHRARIGKTLGRFGAAHPRVHRYLPTCLHTQQRRDISANRDICGLRRLCGPVLLDVSALLFQDSTQVRSDLGELL